MIEPLSIATTCIGLIGGIASLTLHIAAFCNDVRGARKDMNLISRELASLSLCLGALQTDCQSQRIEYPEVAREGIGQALLNIDILTQQMKDIINKLSSGKLGRRIQWTLQSRDTVDRLRSSLETQKAVIEIALQCGSVQMLCKIQIQGETSERDINEVRNITQAIHEDTGILRTQATDIQELIRAEAKTLRIEISSLQQGNQLPTQLQNWLNETRVYSQEVSAALPKPDLGETFSDDSAMGDLQSPPMSDVTQSESRSRDDYPDILRLVDQLEDSQRDRKALQQEVAALHVKVGELAREDQRESRIQSNNPYRNRIAENNPDMRRLADRLEVRERENKDLQDQNATLQVKTSGLAEDQKTMLLRNQHLQDSLMAQEAQRAGMVKEMTALRDRHEELAAAYKKLRQSTRRNPVVGPDGMIPSESGLLVDENGSGVRDPKPKAAPTSALGVGSDVLGNVFRTALSLNQNTADSSRSSGNRNKRDSNRIEGQKVFCHSCSNGWDRDHSGLECPKCKSEFTEVVCVFDESSVPNANISQIEERSSQQSSLPPQSPPSLA